MFQSIQPKRKNVASRRVFSHRPNINGGYQQRRRANMIKKHGNRFAPERRQGIINGFRYCCYFYLCFCPPVRRDIFSGRSAFPESSGRRIDTILLTPDGDAAEQQMQQIFHLAGKINYTNGRPYAQGRFSFTVNQGNRYGHKRELYVFSCGGRGAPDSYFGPYG